MPRLKNIDYLRGFAAFSVLMFHICCTVDNYPTNDLIRNIGSFGHFGVEVFFIISGFIIPYSMRSSGYRPGSNTLTFFLKRLIRVEPAYLISIAFSITLGLVVNSIYQRTIYEYTFGQIISHLFYLTNFFGYEWVNPVYWTLAIEFQFYIFLAIMYPQLFSYYGRLLITLVLVLINIFGISWLNGTLAHYFPYFFIGIAACLFKVGDISRKNLLIYSTIFFILIFVKFGIIELLLSIATQIILVSDAEIKNIKITKFYGLISYSLYLFHYPVVEKLVRIGKVFGFSLTSQLFVVFFSMAIATATSWLVYKLIESPSLFFANRIRYKHKQIINF